MTALSTVVGKGTHAARPSAGTAGALYYETDTYKLFRDNGSTWDELDFTAAAITQGTLAQARGGTGLDTSGATDGQLLIGKTSDGTLGLAALTAGSNVTISNGAHSISIAAASGGSGLYTAYLCYQEQQVSSTNGGTFTSGAWRTRVLNTEVADTGNHGSVASNQITLDAGTYRVQASAPAIAVDTHQVRLQNITDSATLVVGQNAYARNANTAGGVAVLAGRFTIAASKVIELQHQCNVTQATWGLGLACSFQTEVFATVELWKE